MQRSIILFGLGLATLAGCNASDISVGGVAEAQSRSGPKNVSQQFSGNTFDIDVDEETGNTTSIQTAIAKGQPGKAQVSSALVFETEFVFNPDGSCPEGFPLETDVISFEWGEIYDDGSVLSGAVDESQVLCLDVDATVTTSTLTGTIVGATGRFEGAVGSSWRIEVSAVVGSNIATGTLVVDLD